MSSTFTELKPKLRSLFFMELAEAESGKITRVQAARSMAAALRLTAVREASKSDPYLHVILLAAQFEALAQKQGPDGPWRILREKILSLR